VVDVFILQLRRKLDQDSSRPLIQCVRGFGYKISSTGHRHRARLGESEMRAMEIWAALIALSGQDAIGEPDYAASQDQHVEKPIESGHLPSKPPT